jgi:hypothetical protein
LSRCRLETFVFPDIDRFGNSTVYILREKSDAAFVEGEGMPKVTDVVCGCSKRQRLPPEDAYRRHGVPILDIGEVISGISRNVPCPYEMNTESRPRESLLEVPT